MIELNILHICWSCACFRRFVFLEAVARVQCKSFQKFDINHHVMDPSRKLTAPASSAAQYLKQNPYLTKLQRSDHSKCTGLSLLGLLAQHQWPFTLRRRQGREKTLFWEISKTWRFGEFFLFQHVFWKVCRILPQKHHFGSRIFVLVVGLHASWFIPQDLSGELEPWQLLLELLWRPHVSSASLYSLRTHSEVSLVISSYEAPFVKILYMTDLAQKLLSLRIFSYLCTEIAISARI